MLVEITYKKKRKKDVVPLVENYEIKNKCLYMNRLSSTTIIPLVDVKKIEVK